MKKAKRACRVGQALEIGTNILPLSFENDQTFWRFRFEIVQSCKNAITVSRNLFRNLLLTTKMWPASRMNFLDPPFPNSSARQEPTGAMGSIEQQTLRTSRSTSFKIEKSGAFPSRAVI